MATFFTQRPKFKKYNFEQTTCMKSLFLALGLLISSMTMGQALKKESNQPSEKEIRNFLIKNSDWIRGSRYAMKYLIYGFISDGRLFKMKGYGEENMERGKWKLKGNKLYITIFNYSGIGKFYQTEVYTVKIKKGKTQEKNQLILNNKIFKRFDYSN